MHGGGQARRAGGRAGREAYWEYEHYYAQKGDPAKNGHKVVWRESKKFVVVPGSGPRTVRAYPPAPWPLANLPPPNPFPHPLARPPAGPPRVMGCRVEREGLVGVADGLGSHTTFLRPLPSLSMRPKICSAILLRLRRSARSRLWKTRTSNEGSMRIKEGSRKDQGMGRGKG